jgi:phosphopentomutase
MRRRAVVLVLDSLGIGCLPDAARFGDAGSNTLGHIAQACAEGRAESHARPHAPEWIRRTGGLDLPNLSQLGLGFAAELASGSRPAGLDSSVDPRAAFGAARERSQGKDTVSGHWEMMGLPVPRDWGYFWKRKNSVPEALLTALAAECELPGWLGNCHASGTEIIERLGAEHLASGKPIVYTSADSVMQIAAHVDGFGLERLYRLCERARVQVDALRIGRVIARPFAGDAENGFQRTADRRDWAVPPAGPTLLDAMVDSGRQTIGVGKIGDIFAHRGLSAERKASGLAALFDATVDALDAMHGEGMVYTNFVDFDSEYGHRRDVSGYAAALEYFDGRLPELLACLREDDLLLITADHGNDPTWRGSDHTREHVPVLALGAGVVPGSIGVRSSFADLGQSLATFFGLTPLAHGQCFLDPDRIRTR